MGAGCFCREENERRWKAFSYGSSDQDICAPCSPQTRARTPFPTSVTDFTIRPNDPFTVLREVAEYVAESTRYLGEGPPRVA